MVFSLVSRKFSHSIAVLVILLSMNITMSKLDLTINLKQNKGPNELWCSGLLRYGFILSLINPILDGGGGGGKFALPAGFLNIAQKPLGLGS